MELMKTEDGKWFVAAADGLSTAGPFDTGQASRWISDHTELADGSGFRAFPTVNRAHVISIKASLLTSDHLLAIQSLVGGDVYAVPLYELTTDPASGQVSFRTHWSGGNTVAPPSANTPFDVVRP